MTVTRMQAMPASAPKQDISSANRAKDFEKLINQKLSENEKTGQENVAQNKKPDEDNLAENLENSYGFEDETPKTENETTTKQIPAQTNENFVDVAQMLSFLMAQNVTATQATAQQAPPVESLQNEQIANVLPQQTTQNVNADKPPVLTQAPQENIDVDTNLDDVFKQAIDKTLKQNQTNSTVQDATAVEQNTQTQQSKTTDNQQGNAENKGDTQAVQTLKSDAKSQNATETFGADTQTFVEVAVKPNVQTLNPDNVNIKVADVVDTQKETFVQDFTDKILVKIDNNVKEFEIQLNPIELGKVLIKVTFAAEKAFVSINCENAKTSALLSQSSDIIRDIIKQNVGSETVMFVQDNPQQDYTQQQNRQEEQQEQQEKMAKNQRQGDDTQTFINQLRLGLINTVVE